MTNFARPRGVATREQTGFGSKAVYAVESAVSRSASTRRHLELSALPSCLVQRLVSTPLPPILDVHMPSRWSTCCPGQQHLRPSLMSTALVPVIAVHRRGMRSTSRPVVGRGRQRRARTHARTHARSARSGPANPFRAPSTGQIWRRKRRRSRHNGRQSHPAACEGSFQIPAVSGLWVLAHQHAPVAPSPCACLALCSE